MASGDPPPLAGRDTHRASIEAFLRRAATSPAALCLFGGPGAGKTALLDVAEAAATREGMVVLRAAGARTESDVADAVLHQLLYPLHARLSSLPAEHSRTLTSVLGLADGDPPGPGNVAAATTALLRLISPDDPVLLIVDDWQWVDSRSATVLAAVRCGLLVAARAESAAPAREIGAQPLAVGPLDDAHAATLLHDRFPALAERVGRRLLAEGGSNPSALLALAESLSEDQRSGREPLPPQLTPVGRLYRHYQACVVRLPPATRRMLLLAALDGGHGGASPVDGWLAAERTGLGSFDPGEGRWVFHHPMARSAVVRSSTGHERAAAHRDLARLAADRPEQRARHLAEATVGPDESVAVLLQDAAHRALTGGDVLGAVTALLRAADLSVDGPQRSRRLAEAAYIGANAGGDLRTMPALLTAARHADPEGTGSLPIAVAAAHLLFNGDGHIDTAHRLLTGTVDAAVARSANDDPLLVEALYQLADVCFYAARDDLWAPLKDVLSRLGPAVPAMLRVYVQALSSPASLTASDRMRLDAALRSLDGEHDPTVIGRIGRIAVSYNRVEECRAALERVIDDGRAGGAVGSAINAMTMIALDDMKAGRAQAADTMSAEALQLCDAHGYRFAAWPFRLIRMIVAARGGQDDVVREAAVRVGTWAGPRGVRVVAFYCSWAQATLAAGHGDFEETFHHCAAVAAPGVVSPENPVAVAVSLDLIESALRTGRRDQAVAHARAVSAAGLVEVSPAFGLTVLVAAALVAEDEEAHALFARALTQPGAQDLEWDLARAHLFYGERLRRARAVVEARRHLTAAVTSFERMGADPWVTRARRELDATGATRGPGPGSGGTPLTPQERQVAVLAAAGLSNRQIGGKLLVSHRTVAAHLSRAYGKLGVRTRTALGAALGHDEVAEPRHEP
ncbi:LuxR family transcriptional regulator [Paractinoplanes deccanensis]|uniref:LuxR family transcriptional regulator n=1 Tax=Paractinoplanes deccanensis TaxID=113561 RepID=A0ABQ3YJR5_9ACTN|nr:LuxR family transcriptional regulator [Actinoplanes deccanensis]GID80243.1 LuxR family transcriptional regulator [Actinoplanes deccanensis]